MTDLTLLFFKSSSGFWVFYCAFPVGPVPCKILRDFDWCAIIGGEVLYRPKGKIKFTEAELS